jgi:hypothetical protein
MREPLMKWSGAHTVSKGVLGLSFPHWCVISFAAKTNTYYFKVYRNNTMEYANYCVHNANK